MTNMTYLLTTTIWMFSTLIILTILTIQMHPIIMMFLMIMMNILMCLIMSSWSSNYLYSFLIFLIMISGLLIIFMYFSSLISNEYSLFEWMKKSKILMIFSINLLISINLMNSNFMLNLNFHYMNESNPINLLINHKNLNIMTIYLYPMSNITMISIIFLLLSFLSIIKVNSSSHAYSIRKI